MATYPGRKIFMETLKAEGVQYIFGNPGTTEMPIMDSLVDYPEIQYILTLQEAVALSAADAYALLTGKTGVVNLHVAPGLGNAMGMLFNAKEGRSPLVVTAGQQDTRMRLREPVLYDDMVTMARPVTKWAVQAENADELPLLLNRAFKIAQEPPRGPVFVALPINVMIQETDNPPLAPSGLFHRSHPDPAGVAEMAGLLAAAKHPVIVCGDGVGRSGPAAIDALVGLAEALGAPVWGEILPAFTNFPRDHHLFRDQTPGDQAAIRKALGDADTVLLVGGEFFEEVWYEPGAAYPENAVVLQIGASPRELGHNATVRCGLLGDPAASLDAVREALVKAGGSALQDTARQRNEAARAAKQAADEKQQARARKGWDNRPMTTARLMAEIKPALPPDIMLVHEAITAAPDLMRTIPSTGKGDYIAGRGGGIGQALPSGIGAQVAFPGRPTVAITGDGSSLYTIQALWTAAYHKLPVCFIILHNRTYRILKINMNRYRRVAGIDGERGYPHLDLDGPAVDYVKLAEGFGLNARRIEDPAAVAGAVRHALGSGRPWLLEMIVEGGV